MPFTQSLSLMVRIVSYNIQHFLLTHCALRVQLNGWNETEHETDGTYTKFQRKSAEFFVQINEQLWPNEQNFLNKNETNKIF